jgi:hypothetical protein
MSFVDQANVSASVCYLGSRVQNLGFGDCRPSKQRLSKSDFLCFDVNQGLVKLTTGISRLDI